MNSPHRRGTEPEFPPAYTSSRRQLLKLMALGGSLAVGGGLLSACSKRDQSSTNVVLKTVDDWPYGPKPTAKEQKEDPNKKAYAEALQLWLDDNPGVTIKRVTADIWSQQGLVTAISGGTAPAMFQGDMVGGWNRTATKSAMARGLLADVTEQLEQHKVAGRLADFAVPIWDKWAVNGRYYSAPQSYSCGNGIHYRKDLVAELGLKAPEPGWTWDDVRALAKGLTTGQRKGIALQNWVLQQVLEAEGLSLMTQLPAPDSKWNWAWDYTTQADLWVSAIERTRAMMYDDKSVLADISLTDDDVWGAVVKGTAAMHNTTSIHFSAPPGSEVTHIALEEELDKPLEEIMGWMSEPVGVNGYSATTQGEVFLLGFSPDLTDSELSSAVSLHDYMLGPGFVHQRKAIFERTKNARYIYDWGNITPIYKEVLGQLPSSPEEAWGTEFMSTIHATAEIPIAPNPAWYLPVEENTGPTATAYGDMTSRWFYESGDLDVRDDLGKLERTVNKQADGFTSSVADEDFTAGARRYYEAHVKYWQDNAADFYERVFAPWYEGSVRPRLGA
jgi:ABC-type glycerol-3-phosphate transport system substrate-binding protein